MIDFQAHSQLTAMAAAFEAKSTAAERVSPDESLATRAPIKQSPAQVVSTAFVF